MPICTAVAKCKAPMHASIATRIGQEPGAPAQNRKNQTVRFDKLDGPVLSISTTVRGAVGTR
jgi:hypothetical protein